MSATDIISSDIRAAGRGLFTKYSVFQFLAGYIHLEKSDEILRRPLK